MTMVWVWVLISALAVGAWIGFGGYLVTGRGLGPNPPPPWMAAILLGIFGVGMPSLMWSFRLVVEVGDQELRWWFRPFVKKSVPLTEIESVEACSYRPIRDYLGWGIRYGLGNGWAYTVGGNRGVRLRLTSGKRILLGSRDPETLAAHIERARAGVA